MMERAVRSEDIERYRRALTELGGEASIEQLSKRTGTMYTKRQASRTRIAIDYVCRRHVILVNGNGRGMLASMSASRL